MLQKEFCDNTTFLQNTWHSWFCKSTYAPFHGILKPAISVDNLAENKVVETFLVSTEITATPQIIIIVLTICETPKPPTQLQYFMTVKRVIGPRTNVDYTKCNIPLQPKLRIIFLQVYFSVNDQPYQQIYYGRTYT